MRAAAAEARRERDRRRRILEAKRPPANVIMSDTQRQAVEGALAHTRALDADQGVHLSTTPSGVLSGHLEQTIGTTGALPL
jgi:hypothetical protein